MTRLKDEEEKKRTGEERGREGMDRKGKAKTTEDNWNKKHYQENRKVTDNQKLKVKWVVKQGKERKWRTVLP